MVDDYLDREDRNLERLETYEKKFKIEKLVEDRILSVVKYAKNEKLTSKEFQ